MWPLDPNSSTINVPPAQLSPQAGATGEMTPKYCHGSSFLENTYLVFWVLLVLIIHIHGN